MPMVHIYADSARATL